MSRESQRPPGIQEIYRQHHAALKGYIARQVKLREEVEDILQEAFYHLARLDPVKAPVEQVSAWLHTVARNLVIDRGRKRGEERLPARDDEEWLADVSGILRDEDDTPFTSLLKTLFWEELDRALDELPASQRSIFELTEIEGFSFKEISLSAGIPVNTLLSRKRRAILHLRKRLRQIYQEIIDA